MRAQVGVEKTGHRKTENAKIITDIHASAKISGEVLCFLFLFLSPRLIGD